MKEHVSFTKANQNSLIVYQMLPRAGYAILIVGFAVNVVNEELEISTSGAEEAVLSVISQSLNEDLVTAQTHYLCVSTAQTHYLCVSTAQTHYLFVSTVLNLFLIPVFCPMHLQHQLTELLVYTV